MFAAELDVSAVPDRRSYSPGDTAVLIVEIGIPPGYYVCANPVGPGPGKPLELLPAEGGGVRWVEVRASEPRRIGEENEWVWGYRYRATLYAVGIVTRERSSTVEGTLILDGQLCRKGCELFRRTVGYQFRVDAGARRGQAFEAAARHRARFARARPMPVRFARQAPATTAAADTARAAVVQPVSAAAATPRQRALVQALAAQSGEPPGPAPDTAAVRPSAAWEHALTWDYAPQEARREYNLWLALLLAFAGGMLLNVMPCVLPVLGIKILSLSEGRSASRRRTLVRSLAFAAGMVTVFAALATLAAFANFSWGEQFRSPHALAAIICVIVVFALGLFDLYALVAPASLAATRAGRSEGLAGDFLRGVFSTVMATPCSGPLLGATLAWTLLQPVAVIYTVFIAIGAGMALPYVVLASSSTLMRFVPRPGRWMDDFKHAMGFVLLAFAVYLMVGLRAEMIVATLAACLALTLAIYVYQRFAPLNVSRARRGWVAAAAVALAAAGFQFSFGVLLPVFSAARSESQPQTGDLDWRAFSPEALEEAHARGLHVLVDFTAAWCLNCQYNKAVVIESRAVRRLLERKRVVLLRADLTTENRAAESLLEHLGSRSVPFLAVFPGDDPYNPVVLRDVVSRRSLLKVLGRLPDR